MQLTDDHAAGVVDIADRRPVASRPTIDPGTGRRASAGAQRIAAGPEGKLVALTIIDSQVHLWAADLPAHPWLPEREELSRDVRASFDADDLLGEMGPAGVAAAVVIPASFAGWSNDVVMAAARAHPTRLAAMAIIRLEEEHGRPVVEGCDPGSGIHGLRVTCYLEPQRTQLREGVADWLWPLAEELDIPVMVNAPGMLDTVAAIAHRHPSLRLAVDHCGVHSRDRHLPLRPRVEPVFALATLPNVCVKTSALLLQAREPYPFRDLHSIVEDVVAAFGPRRVMWGSDVTRLPMPYSQAVSMYTDELPFLDDEAKEWVMGRSLTEWLRWDVPPGRRAGSVVARTTEPSKEGSCPG